MSPNGAQTDDEWRMIHPDARDPEAEFTGWLRRLLNEAEDTGVPTSAIIEELRRKATEAENDVDEWGTCEGCNETVPKSEREPVRPGGARSCLEPVHLCPGCRDAA